MEQKYLYNSIEEALEDLKAGKIILVTDDPDRENEGDMICAAQYASQENINFMASYAKGLILYCIYSFRRPCRYVDRNLGGGTVLYDDEMCG